MRLPTLPPRLRLLNLLLILLLLLVLAAGCATVREARQLQQEDHVPPPGERTVSAEEAGITPGCTLTLEQLEQIALRCQPALYQSRLEVERARLSLANARAGYLPTLSSSLSHSRSTQNTDPHRESTRNRGSYSGGVNLSLTIYDFGRTSAQVQQAQDSLSAALQSLEEQECATLYQVRQSYFQLRRAVELHGVAQEAVEQYRDHWEQMKTKRAVGASTEYDVLKAEVDYQQARLKEITTANDVALGWTDLNRSLGLTQVPEYHLGDCQLQEYPQSVPELMAMAQETSPSLGALRYRVRVASGALDAAIADLYPNLSLSLGGSLSGRNPGLPWLWNLNGGLSLGQSIFQGGRLTNAIRQAMLSLQSARSSYADGEQALFRSLTSAVLTSVRARLSLEVADLAAQAAQRNLEIVNEKFRNGKATSVDRTDAQVSYSSAKAEAVNARFDYLEAQATIANLLGDTSRPGEALPAQ
ncbi:MAG: TolC family protein [Oligosphaeraceae bacterium]